MPKTKKKERTLFSSVGRRKTSIARIHLSKGKGFIKINNLDIKEFFCLDQHINQALFPLYVTGNEAAFDVKIRVSGGGISGQAGAISLGLARAILECDETNRSSLKANGLLTRDPRMVERKKYGQAKARKKFQFSKR